MVLSAWASNCVLDTRNVRHLAHWDVNSEAVRVVFLHKQFRSLGNAGALLFCCMCSASLDAASLEMHAWRALYAVSFSSSSW